MKKLIKYLVLVIISALGIVTIASCSKGKKVSWEISTEDIKSAVELSQETIVSDNKLKVNITYQDDVFKNNLHKDYVKVLDYNAKLFDIEKLDDLSVDFEFKQDSNKKIEIEISDYKETGYTIIVNKKGMKDNVYGVTLVTLKDNSVVIQEKYLELESKDYYVDEINPTFNIYYNNYEINTINDIEFAGAFSDLEIDDIVHDAEAKTINIKTEGYINNDTFGTVILKKNFFKDLEGDINLVSNVEKVDAIIQGIDVSNSEKFIINVKLINQTASLDFGKSDIYIPVVDTQNVTVDSNDRSLIRIEINSGNDNKGINNLLEGRTFEFNGSKLSSNKDICITYIGYKASFSINKVIDEDNFRLYVKPINGELSAVETVICNIEGINASPVISAYGDGFKVEYTLPQGGTYNGIISATVTDIFGEILNIEASFSVLYPTLGTSDVDIQKFNEDVIDAKVNAKDAFASAMMFMLYATQIGISISPYGNACAGISSIISMLNFMGVSKGLLPLSPSIGDVMKKLDIMDKKLDEISEKLDRLSETIKEESAAIQMGIDKALYVIYKSSWENFYNGSINELDNILRDYGNAYRNYLVNKFKVMDSSSTLNLKIYYCYEENADGNDKLVVCEPSKVNPQYTIDGKLISNVDEFNIPGSYFANLYTLVNEEGYTDEFDEALKSALADYATVSSDFNEEEAYNAILSEAQKNVITTELSNKLTNAFCNFARGVYHNGNSQLNNFFGMVESLYNFQKEAKLSIDSMRASLKNQLVLYGSFVSMFAEYSENNIDKNEVIQLLDDACEFISAYSGNRNGNYSYITKTNISTSLLRISMKAVYYNPGPGCQFNTYFTPCSVNKDGSYTLIEYFNNQSLIDQTAILKMRARFDILRTMNVDYVDKTFEQYLISLGILEDWNSVYAKARSNNKGKDLPQDLTITTSFDGIGTTGDQGNNYICSSNGWGDYFTVGNIYQYKGTREEDCWSGAEAKGTIFTFKNMVSYGNVINRYARYDESHFYWYTDEHHSFELYSDGFYTLVFYKS